MRRVIFLLLFIAFVSPPKIHWDAIGQETEATALPSAADAPLTPGAPLTANAPSGGESSADEFPIQALQENLEGDFDAEAVVATTGWINSTGIVDWLGPLAPVALSPFFGITCLSALSLWGPEWATDNALLGSAGPLQNETMFVVFLVLTLLTSVPRLTKVSKPFAQAVDRLETYSVIVILLAIKIFATSESPELVAAADQPQAQLMHAGIVSFSVDAFLAIAMVINVLVINSVKFFFEFMVWLTPIPFLDAVFEVCNKSLCVCLMAIYAFSPTVATIINLGMLLFAAIVLRWISRRVRFYRTMVLDPVIARLWSGFGKPKQPELIVFPKGEFGPFKAKSRLRLRRADGDDGGWTLKEANWWMPSGEHKLSADAQPQVRHGWIMHAIEVKENDGTETTLSFSRRYDAEAIAQLAQQLGIEVNHDAADETQSELAYEFS